MRVLAVGSIDAGKVFAASHCINDSAIWNVADAKSGNDAITGLHRQFGVVGLVF
jgi:hypothetical protein